MALVREGKLLTSFNVPYKGTWKALSAHQLTQDALYDSSNVFIRQGKLRTRPGLSNFASVISGDVIIGGQSAYDPVTGITFVAISNGHVYELPPSGTVWGLTSSGTYANDANGIIDMAFLQTAGTYVGLVASEGFPLKRWVRNAGISAITPNTGTVPTSVKSVCISQRRVVMLIPPHTVQWTQVLSYQDFPALAYNIVAQTNDPGICVRSLSALSFVFYKQRSIYPVRAQAGTDAQAFAFGEPIRVEGPAGVHAIVDVAGNHVYMTASGRIAIFDGTKYPQWIADGVWLFLQQDIDPAFTYKIFGVYDYRLHVVVFFYPKIGDNGIMRGMVVINLPLEGSGLIESRATDQTSLYLGTVPAVFLGTCGVACTHGYEIRVNLQIDRAGFFILSSQLATFDETVTSDAMQPFSSYFQTGLATMPDFQHHQLNVESFFERSDAYGFVTVQPVVSDLLETPGGSVGIDEPTDLRNMSPVTGIINLNDTDVKQEYIGFNLPTRFFGLKYSWDSTATVRYAGAMVYGRPTTGLLQAGR